MSSHYEKLSASLPIVQLDDFVIKWSSTLAQTTVFELSDSYASLYPINLMHIVISTSWARELLRTCLTTEEEQGRESGKQHKSVVPPGFHVVKNKALEPALCLREDVS